MGETPEVIETLQIGDWRVYPTRNRIVRCGEDVTLQNLSMRVLVYLAQKSGEVASYDELLEKLWPGRVAGEDAVHRRIADLRRHLKDDARNPRYIETISKQGYRLIKPVESGRRGSMVNVSRPVLSSLALGSIIALLSAVLLIL